MTTKSLGPANDAGVPDDEITVAALVQNARAHGLEWTSGTFYRDKNNNHVPFSELVKKRIASCCAQGAMHLCKDDFIRVEPSSNGNDADFYPQQQFEISPSYMAGAGFRCAMQP